MWNLKKAGILTFMLVIPVLFFLWIRFGGENHYTLPRYFPMKDSTSGAVLIKRKGPTRQWWEPEQDTVFHTIPAFKLLTQDSVWINRTLMKGKIVVADFFFSRCPTICPKMSAQMSRVQDIFRGNQKIKFLSYSIDPIHDTPSVLKAYAKRYDAEPNQWFFLTGDKQQIYKLAINGYKLPVQDDGKNNTENETFTHDSKLVLVDKEGVIRGYYDGEDKAEIDRLILEIRVLLDIYKKQNKE
ncbi:MAG: SCO family protein [Siphonobacter sp.]